MRSSHLRRPLLVAAVVITTAVASSVATLAAASGAVRALAVPFEVQSQADEDAVAEAHAAGSQPMIKASLK